MNRVLILSSADDNHAKVVANHLGKMNVDVDLLRKDEFIRQCKLVYKTGSYNSQCRIRTPAGDLNPYLYKGIWHRRPGVMKSDAFVEPWISRMVEQESNTAFEGILRTVDCIWVNYPPNDVACLNKLWQLHLAVKLGLMIPDTLITNDPDAVKEFFEQCNGSVIYKFISEHTNQMLPKNERPAGISTLPLRFADLEFIDQVRHAPHQFQKAISKAYELRVTVVGKKVFCVRIESQSGRGTVDWRLDYTVPMAPYSLPLEIEQQCLELTRLLGLNYGAIDLIVDLDGRYIFLEINCAGQFLWIEDRMDLPVSLEMAKLLAGMSEPLVANPRTMAPSL